MLQPTQGDADHALKTLQRPLEDFALIQSDIPAPLQFAGLPYTSPPQNLCIELFKEIDTLDAVLGQDEDIVVLPWLEEENLLADGMGLVRDQAFGFISSKIDIIPFRGLIRKISGAERHDKALAKAYELGRLRRAFLKGFATAHSCLRGQGVIAGLQ